MSCHVMSCHYAMLLLLLCALLCAACLHNSITVGTCTRQCTAVHCRCCCLHSHCCCWWCYHVCGCCCMCVMSPLIVHVAVLSAVNAPSGIPHCHSSVRHTTYQRREQHQCWCWRQRSALTAAHTPTLLLCLTLCCLVVLLVLLGRSQRARARVSVMLLCSTEHFQQRSYREQSRSSLSQQSQ